MIAALFVEKNGVYFNLAGVIPYDKEQNAFSYRGPHPVVAHPPCARWGKYATYKGQTLGDDGGTFSQALLDVRLFGGVLEHPAYSKAFQHYGLGRPPPVGGWILSEDGRGHLCHVEQGHYGHLGKKATWLYAYRTELPELFWGPSNKTRPVEDLSKRQRVWTPIPFRNLLINIAETANDRRH